MLEISIGLTIAAVLLFDILQAVLVPRFTPNSLRLAPILIARFVWPCYRKIAGLFKSETRQDLFLGAFAPFAFVLIFVIWLVGLVFGFALVIHGMGGHFDPKVHSFAMALYLSGTSLMTLGFGDIVGISTAGRFVLLLCAATGIIIVAIGVSCLFTVRQSVHSREIMVNTFQSRITPRASAVNLLLNYSELGIVNLLVGEIQGWETWIAEVLASHRSIPLICYFRSAHMSASWLTVMGIMLDTANLLTTTINDRRFGHAEFFLQIGCKTVNFFRDYFRLPPVSICISKEEFHEAYVLLQERGFKLNEEDVSWEKFHATRSEYAPSLNALCFAFMVQVPDWLATNPECAVSSSSRAPEKLPVQEPLNRG